MTYFGLKEPVQLSRMTRIFVGYSILLVPAKSAAEYAHQLQKNPIMRGNSGFSLIERTLAKICDGVYTTGELGTWIKEQSLVINTDKGLVVISGCAHPGIVDIVKKAKEQLNKNVYLVLGGFHSPPLSVVQKFRELGVEKVAPCHCTGDEAIRAFKEEYQENFIENGVGKIISIY